MGKGTGLRVTRNLPEVTGEDGGDGDTVCCKVGTVGDLSAVNRDLGWDFPCFRNCCVVEVLEENFTGVELGFAGLELLLLLDSERTARAIGIEEDVAV